MQFIILSHFYTESEWCRRSQTLTSSPSGPKMSTSPHTATINSIPVSYGSDNFASQPAAFIGNSFINNTNNNVPCPPSGYPHHHHLHHHHHHHSHPSHLSSSSNNNNCNDNSIQSWNSSSVFTSGTGQRPEATANAIWSHSSFPGTSNSGPENFR